VGGGVYNELYQIYTGGKIMNNKLVAKKSNKSIVTVVTFVLCLLLSAMFLFSGCNAGNSIKAITTDEIKQAMNKFDTKITAVAAASASVNSISLNNGAKNANGGTSSLGLSYDLYHDEMTASEQELADSLSDFKSAFFDEIKDIVNSEEVVFEPYKVYIDNTEEGKWYITCMVTLDIETRTIVAYYSSLDTEDGSYAQNIRFELQLTNDGVDWQRAKFLVIENMRGSDMGLTSLEIINDLQSENKVTAMNRLNADEEGLTQIYSLDFNNSKYLSDLSALSYARQRLLFAKNFTSQMAYLDFFPDENTAP